MASLLLFLAAATAALSPFTVNLTRNVPHLQLLLQHTHLPTHTLYPDAGIDLGIQLDFLSALRDEWTNEYDWKQQEASLNELSHFTAAVEGINIHFVREKSRGPNAIPLLLLHGWPGSFQEYLPTIKPLTELWTSPTGQQLSFDVVVPSLPGFVFSSAPPQNWSTNDTARVFNTLMTKILGYKTFAVHGSDRGAQIAYHMYSVFNASVRAAHVHSLPFLAPTPDEISAANITLSSITQVTEQRTVNYRATGMSYFTEQTLKPNTIGLALYDNPIGQLAWIGGNIQLWSDPRAGTPPSVLNSTTLLTMVSLYYLTKTFQSSVWVYAQNPNTFSADYVAPLTDAPLGFSVFEYDLMLWPKEYVNRATNNLAFYNEHDFGGHFPGLDNPPALIADLRELGTHFKS
ncbi:Alpha/Beta hydrolase protein [Mycena amicta]|nr:Alpha/Beta hydrolase protein [Mycena amicta]